MKQLYVIDGYNLLFHLYGERPSLQSARDRLVADLQHLAAERKKTARFFVIFDAHNRSELAEAPFKGHKSDLEFIFTKRGQTADAFICDYFASFSKRKMGANPILVSSDKTLCASIKGGGYSAISVFDFCAQLLSFEPKSASLEASSTAASGRELDGTKNRNKPLPGRVPDYYHEEISPPQELPPLQSGGEWAELFESRLEMYEEKRQAAKKRKRLIKRSR